MVTRPNIRPFSFLLAGFFFFTACGMTPNQSQTKAQEKSATIFSYEPQPVPQFLKQLYQNHEEQFKTYYEEYFEEFCKKHDLATSNSVNQDKFIQLVFMHLLFTSESASNGSQGGILKIPYLWHWVEPNPRHEIIWLPTQQPLSEIAPPAKFNRYASLADVDRTPGIFLSDLFSEKPNYYHPACDSFYTFGWCSEREMAFVMCMEILGYTGKVKSEGNHSWTCLWTTFETTTGDHVPLEVKIDNTFNGISGVLLDKNVSEDVWKKEVGEGRLPNWYNKMAHAQKEREIIQELIVTSAVADRIEKQVAAF